MKEKLLWLKGSLCFHSGMILYKMYHFSHAITLWSSALKAYAQIEDKISESQCYTNIGNVYYRFGYFNKAIECHNLSLSIDESFEDRLGKATCHMNLGAAYFELGNFKDAIEHEEKSLKIYQDIGDKLLEEAKCYTNLGAAYDCLGNARKAIEYHTNALEIANEIGGKEGDLICLICYTNLSVIYHEKLKDLDSAIIYYRRSLNLAKKCHDLIGEASCYMNIGALYSDLNNYPKAIESYKKAFTISEKLQDKSGELTCYAGIGNAYLEMQEFESSIKYYEKSLAIAKDIEDKPSIAIIYSSLSNTYSKLNNYDLMLEYREKSLKLAGDIGDINLQRAINFNLGLFYSVYAPQIGYEHFKRSIELSELMGKDFIEEIHKLKFYRLSVNVYDKMIALCHQLKFQDKMFDYVERSKSKAFLDLLAKTEIHPSDKLRQQAVLLKKEKRCLSNFYTNQMQQRMDIQVPRETVEDLDSILKELTNIYKEMKLFDPEYVFMRQGYSSSFDQIKKVLSK